MTRPPRPDDDLDDIGPDIDALSARYDADYEGIEPPDHLDAEVRAAAHRAVDARPLAAGARRSPSTSLLRRMRVPFGLAATIVAVGSITIAIWKESPDKLEIPSDHPPTVTGKRTPGSSAVGAPGDRALATSSAQLAAPLQLPSPPPASITAAAGSPAKALAPHLRRSNEPLPAEGKRTATAPLPATNLATAAQLNEAKPSGSTLLPDVRAKAAQPEKQPLDRVTVTGSNLRRADTETPSPVQVIRLPDDVATATGSPPAPAPAPVLVPAPALSAPPPTLPDQVGSVPPPAPSPPLMSAPSLASSSSAPRPAAQNLCADCGAHRGASVSSPGHCSSDACTSSSTVCASASQANRASTRCIDLGGARLTIDAGTLGDA